VVATQHPLAPKRYLPNLPKLPNLPTESTHPVTAFLLWGVYQGRRSSVDISRNLYRSLPCNVMRLSKPASRSRHRDRL